MSYFKTIMHNFVNIKNLLLPLQLNMGLQRKGKGTRPKNETTVTTYHVHQLLHLGIQISPQCQFQSCTQTLPWHTVQTLPPMSRPTHEAWRYKLINYKSITTNFAYRTCHKMSTCTYCTSAVWSKSVKEKEIYSRYVTPYTYPNMILVLIPIQRFIRHNITYDCETHAIILPHCPKLFSQLKNTKQNYINLWYFVYVYTNSWGCHYIHISLVEFSIRLLQKPPFRNITPILLHQYYRLKKKKRKKKKAQTEPSYTDYIVTDMYSRTSAKCADLLIREPYHALIVMEQC